MEHYAGIDVSLEQSSVCVVDGTGRIVREARVASEPEALVRFLGQLGLVVTRIGVEAGPAVAMAACRPDAGRARGGGRCVQADNQCSGGKPTGLAKLPSPTAPKSMTLKICLCH